MSEVRIEAPDAASASLLQGRLTEGTQIVVLPGRCELHVTDIPLSHLPSLLLAVERWMLTEGIGSVAVHLDERRYVLVPRGLTRVL